ncbi:helix-turn-helix transcriptional regulator [Candidatus Bathyarchaeota archaeon]|nr:helix-turn-helix transcriptional regulator [Candidatus Bathyarchaeota archaeon]
MYSEAEQQEIFKALRHRLRRDVLYFLSAGPATYSEMLDSFGVESGLLAYHLRNMGGLVKKDGEGRYTLTALGEEALRFIEKEQQSEEKPSDRYHRIAVAPALFLVVIILAFLGSAYSNMEHQRSMETELLCEETMSIVDDALGLVYGVFEEWEVDRATWTELLISLVKLDENLGELAETGEYAGLSIYGETLPTYIDEFKGVLMNSDDRYPSLTIEKRHLIRELHTMLLEIKDQIGVK